MTYGRVGRISVDIALAASQMGFCCAYVYFIKELYHDMIYSLSYGETDINPNWFALIEFVVFSLLCWIRKIEKLNFTHIFADVMIVITIITVFAYAGLDIGKNGSSLKTVDFFNPATYADGIGFAVYSYEGIGIIMPVQDICAKPETYMWIVYACILTVAVLYVIFGQVCAIAWGAGITSPLITDKLPGDPVANPDDYWVGWTIKVLFSLNLIFTFPLVLYPAHRVLENYIFAGWAKSKKRQWLKNLSRTILVAVVTGFTVAMGHTIDSFIPVLGAFTCTPIAFMFPAIFHYQACAATRAERVIDLSIFGLGVAIMIFCTIEGIRNWED